MDRARVRGRGGTKVQHADRVEHVVVLMLENHSFDHLLGFLRHPRRENFDGLKADAYFNVAHDGTYVYASDDGVPEGLDPNHSHSGALEQLSRVGPVLTNGGFVRSYEAERPGHGAEVMRCLDPTIHCRVLATLATEFAVCTSWFSSVPGETWPNRNFAHAATSDGAVDIEGGVYLDPTIFQRVERVRRDWRIYYDGPPQVWCFVRLWQPRLFLDFVLRRKPRIGNWFTMNQFAAHVQDGELAAYTFIEPAHNTVGSGATPRRTNSQHPHNNVSGRTDFVAGEKLIRDVYEALRSNPDLFARTVLLITYDEHGGLYDHVEPPAATPPGDFVLRGPIRRLWRFLRWRNDARVGRRSTRHPYDFKKLGVRVPAVIVSPWIAPHTICHETFDHSSIPATVRQVFAPRLKPLTKRDAAAPPFHEPVTSSPLPAARPNPDDPNPHDLPPLPDLSDLELPSPPKAAPRADVDGQEPLEPGLQELAAMVERELSRRPSAGMLRRGVPVPHTAGPRRAEDLFAATARGARQRARPRARRTKPRDRRSDQRTSNSDGSEVK